MVDATAPETCLLSVDYGLLHVAMVLWMLLVCWRKGRTQAFFSAHCFGLVAMIFDYGLFYLTRGTRTVIAVTMEQDPLSSVGHFLFFSWYDYLGAFGVIVWARELQAYLGGDKQASLFVLLHHPILFWTAPWIFNYLPMLDGRFILVSRPSPKAQYVVLLVVFIAALALKGLSWRKQIFPVLASGLGCGLVHHAALFTFGMRGYTDLQSLAITLATEWPALIAGEAFVRYLAADSNDKNASSPFRLDKLFNYALWGALLALVLPNVDVEHGINELIPVLPGEQMQAIGTFFMRAKTCWLPEYLPAAVLPPTVQCREEGDNSIWVLATPAKSGAVLTAKLAFDLGGACGLCIASPQRDGPGIPSAEEELPDYDGEILHAMMYMKKWPEYASSRGVEAKCITITRDPLDRLRSFYLYARSGGEHWVRNFGLQQALLAAPDLDSSIQVFWEMSGKDYLEQSHDYYLHNIAHGCTQLRFTEIKNDYNATMERLLDTFDVRAEARPTLREMMKKHDLGAKTVHERKNDKHVSTSQFTKEFVQEVTQKLATAPYIRELTDKQMAEVPYRL